MNNQLELAAPGRQPRAPSRAKVGLVAVMAAFCFGHIVLNIIGMLNCVFVGCFVCAVVLSAQIGTDMYQDEINEAKGALKEVRKTIQNVKKKIPFIKQEDPKASGKLENRMLQYMPGQVKVLITEWSLFDMLCMTYVIRDYIINAVAVFSAFA